MAPSVERGSGPPAYPGEVDEPATSDPTRPGAPFRLGFVPGATPAKWARTWRARHPGTPLELVPLPAADAERAVVDGALDAAILRLPVDRDVLHAIPLYVEEPVVVVPRDHLLAALEEDEAVTPADLADEIVLQPADDVLPWRGRPGAEDDAVDPPGRPPLETPATTVDAIALVAAGIGVAVVPRSLARLHHRKDTAVRTLAGGPGAPVGLAWAIAREDERTEDLVGIVRGRTVNSSRGRREPTAPATSAATGTPRRTQQDRTQQGRGGARRTPQPRRGRRRR